MSIEAFKDALNHRQDIQGLRMDNWGQWGKGGFPDFEPASWFDVFNEFLPDERQRKNIAERDAQHLEDIITGFDLQCRNNTDSKPKGARKFGTVWCMALKIQFHERERPLSARAEEIRKRLKRPCAERTFQHHVQQAKQAVFLFADPL